MLTAAEHEIYATYASVAQWLEPRPSNLAVACSSPGGAGHVSAMLRINNLAIIGYAWRKFFLHILKLSPYDLSCW